VRADGDMVFTEVPNAILAPRSAEELRQLVSRSFTWMEALDRRALNSLTPPLTVPQAHALEALAEKPDQSLGELANRLLTVKSNASGIVDRLQSLGLVERHEDPVDTRRIRLRLTQAGVNSLAQASQARGAALAGVFGSQDHDRILALTDLLRNLVVLLQQAIKE
jgi:DNA-binding MarR family transcriptional regulator